MNEHDLKTGDTLADRFDGVRGWLTEKEAVALAEIAKDKTVLEIGSFCGRSTIAMGRTAFRVYALDWHRGDVTIGFDADTLAEFRANLKAAQVFNVIPLVGRTEQMKDIVGESWADVVFVDGGHDYASVKVDLEFAKSCLKPGGTIAVHDWDRPQIVRAFHEVFGFPIGAERQVYVTYIAENIVKQENKGLTRQDLIQMQAGIEQQQAYWNQQKVHANAQIDSVGGSKQAVDHLLKLLDIREGVQPPVSDEVARLREELEQAKADADMLRLAGEQDAKMAKELAEQIKGERNGVVADVTG